MAMATAALGRCPVREKAIPIGTPFGHLKVSGSPFTKGEGRQTRVYYPCKCVCGKEKPVRKDALKPDSPLSCGCKRIESVVASATKHGGCGTRLYNTWLNIQARCHNPNAPRYADYGGRGITVCPEWQADFGAFRDWALANGYRDDLEIDRKDNNGPYSASNCQWTTRRAQLRNTRANKNLAVFGETKCLTDWANDPRCKVSRAALLARLNAGWTGEAALTTEPTPTNQRRRKLTPR